MNGNETKKSKGERRLNFRQIKENQMLQLMMLPISMVCVLGLLIFYTQLRPEEASAQPLPEITISGERQTAAPPDGPSLKLDKGQLLAGTSYQGDTVRKYVSEEDIRHGFMVLVNYQWKLPEDYAPRDMVVTNDLIESGNRAGFAASKANMKLNATAFEQVEKMVYDACDQDGLKGFLLGSTFRDFSYQTILYRNKLSYYKGLGYRGQEAEEKAAFWVARPYTSEHHTGLAIDIPSRDHRNLNGAYGKTENGIWLEENAWKYGFVVRYAEEKSDITKVGYEPWHIRYVGKPHSEILKTRGWTLEEYIEYIRQEKGFTYRCLDDSLWQIEYQQPTDEGYVLLPQIEGALLSGDNIDGYILTTPLSSLPVEDGSIIRLPEAEKPEPYRGDGSAALDEDPPEGATH